MTTPSSTVSTSHAPAARFAPHHVQLARAAAAAIAALMITFSPDHSAAVGLAVFSGFGILTALVLLLAAWLTFSSGQRGMPILLGMLALVAGMVAGVGPWRTDATLFAVVIAWALTSGIAEGAWGWGGRRSTVTTRATARDHLTVGVLTVALGAALLVIPVGYSLEYTIAATGTFTLTGTTIAVGVFGGYAAIVAVYLAIAGFSPRPTPSPSGEGRAGVEPTPRREGSA